MRNASCTTVAPTGSISIIAGCGAGIEPIYRLAYRRRALDGREFVEVHPLVEEIGEREGWLTNTVREALLEGASASDIRGIPRKWAETLIEQLKGIRCLSTSVARKGNHEVTVLSCPDAIARAIEESLRNVTTGSGPAPADCRRRCPDCGAVLRREAGCLVCRCGFSSCG